MTLTLRIQNLDRLENGTPAEFVLHRRNAVIGRLSTNDWPLPDPNKFISSKHCEVRFGDGFYTLSDISLNGTFLNGSPKRMEAPRRIEDGDSFTIGHYQIAARLSGEARAAIEGEARDRASPEAISEIWDDEPVPAPSGPVDDRDPDWDLLPDPPRSAQGMRPAHAARTAEVDIWDPEPEPVRRSSIWSSDMPDEGAEPTGEDIWGKLEGGNAIDWARMYDEEDGRADRFRRNGPPHSTPSASTEEWDLSEDSEEDWEIRPTSASQQSNQQQPAPDAEPEPGAFDAFLDAANLDPERLQEGPEETLDRAGQLLRTLVAGLFLMVEARTRAKTQLGAEVTRFGFSENNPLKFAETPDDALLQLLNPPQQRFIDAVEAVEDAFFDLQSHQMATLKAMQGALRATLDRFSPQAIGRRAEAKGLARLLPNAREAALWRAYEKEFGGVAKGSDEAFVDVFAREFLKAYEEQAGQPRRR